MFITNLACTYIDMKFKIFILKTFKFIQFLQYKNFFNFPIVIRFEYI